MSASAKTRLIYGGLAVLSMMLTALYGEIMAGHVAFPDGWAFLAPVISAGLVGATALLPRVSDVQRERG